MELSIPGQIEQDFSQEQFLHSDITAINNLLLKVNHSEKQPVKMIGGRK